MTTCAIAIGRAKEPRTMIALFAAISSIAATIAGPPVQRGYQNGTQCGQGSGCFSYQLVIDCLKCCTLNCAYGGFLQACQAGCVGAPPPPGGDGGPGGRVPGSEVFEAQIVAYITEEAEKVASGKQIGNDLAWSVDFVVSACHDNDAHLSMCARAIAEQTPIIAAALKHSEKGRQHEDPDRAS